MAVGSLATRQRYSDAIRHVSDVIGNVELSDLRARDVRKVRDTLEGKGLAPETVAGVLRVLFQGLSYAEAEEFVSRNYASPELVTRPVGSAREFVKIDAALAQRILAAVMERDPWDARCISRSGSGCDAKRCSG